MAKNITAEVEGINATKAVAESIVSKYAINQLRDNCLQLFGVGVSTFDGATCNIANKCTVDEIKNILKEWKKKEAK